MQIVATFIIITCSILLSSCSSNKTPQINTTIDKDTLKNLHVENNHKATVNSIRIQALRDTALSIGARGGLAKRANQTNKILLGYEKYLTRTFNFYGMLLDKNVLPPVLIEARNTLQLTGTDAIRIADRNYKIIQQAKFVTSPPTWQDYLWMEYNAPEIPHKSLLPKNNAEEIIWKKYIDEGWDAGLTQASIIFTENMNRLTRDYGGMIRYRRLLAQNMVSAPYVATLDLGITGDNSDMTIHDKVLRITAFPSLQTNSSQWKTEIRLHE